MLLTKNNPLCQKRSIILSKQIVSNPKKSHILHCYALSDNKGYEDITGNRRQEVVVTSVDHATAIYHYLLLQKHFDRLFLLQHTENGMNSMDY